MNLVKKKSRKQEAQTAKDIGGKTTIASGALVQKGDVFNDKLLVECKTTEKDFYSLKKTTWDKIFKEAVRNSNMRIPVMRIDLKDSSTHSYAIMQENNFTLWCYGKAVYVLDIENANEKSYRVVDISDHFVNADIIVGKHFAFEQDKGIVQIRWSDFIKLFNMVYEK